MGSDASVLGYRRTESGFRYVGAWRPLRLDTGRAARWLARQEYRVRPGIRLPGRHLAWREWGREWGRDLRLRP